MELFGDLIGYFDILVDDAMLDLFLVFRVEGRSSKLHLEEHCALTNAYIIRGGGVFIKSQ